jgi:hypothetical protein
MARALKRRGPPEVRYMTEQTKRRPKRNHGSPKLVTARRFSGKQGSVLRASRSVRRWAQEAAAAESFPTFDLPSWVTVNDFVGGFSGGF